MIEQLKLSEKEKLVLRLIQLQADRPLAELAKLSGLKERAIRYAIDQLREKNLLIPRTLVNFSAVGYSRYQLLIGCPANPTPEMLSRRLIEHRRVEFVDELEGEFRYCVYLILAGWQEAYDVIAELTAGLGESVGEFCLLPTLSAKFFGSGFLANISCKLPTLEWSHGPKLHLPDANDLRILSTLHESGETNLLRLQKATGLPQATINYRLGKMKKAGVIVGRFYVVNPAKYGIPSFYLLIHTRSFDRRSHADFTEFCLRHPLVDSLFHYCSGIQYMLDVPAPDHRKLSKLIKEIEQRFASYVGQITTLPHIGWLKSKDFQLD